MDRRLASEWEDRDAARIARVRARHDELRQRFLNPNIRLTGRDESFLAEQVLARSQAKRSEREEDEEYARYLREMQYKLEEMDAEEKAARKQRARELAEEWQSEALRKKEEEERERRLTKEFETKFELDGEDEGHRSRKGLQQKQMRKWVAQQHAEREEAKAQRLREENEEKERLDLALKLANEREREMERLRRKQLEEDRAFNETMARKKRDEQVFRSKLDCEWEQQELSRAQQDQDVSAKSTLSPFRYRPDHFRGLEKERLEQIKQEQWRQMQEKRAREAREREEAHALAKKEEELLHMANFYNYEDQVARASTVKSIQEENMRRAELKRMQELERKRNSPGIGDEFFNGFGKSHR